MLIAKKLHVLLVLDDSTHKVAKIQDGILEENTDTLEEVTENGVLFLMRLILDIARHEGLHVVVTNEEQYAQMRLPKVIPEGWDLRFSVYDQQGYILGDARLDGHLVLDTELDRVSLVELINILAEGKLFHFPFRLQA